LACEGTALLWRGDFHNAAQLLQAMARRADRTPARKQRKEPANAGSPADVFHQYRLSQSQRARILASLLIPFNADYGIELRRAPDARQACAEAWGAADADTGSSIASLRELLGIIGAHEWRKKGVEIPALGEAPHNRIHPHYGVFSPVRGEYVNLVATAPLPPPGQQRYVAFDIGTGTGVLAAVLARRDIDHVVATDRDPRALACARENIDRLGVSGQVEVVHADLFPEGRASLVVCNPPWLPARPASALEAAVYDEDSRMLLGFLNGLTAHIEPGGEGWLILSDFAEHLGLRTRAELLTAFESSGLKVLGRINTKPRHPKASDASDPLHCARAAEVTSLWRLAASEP
jgi:SAM-dependent methyltransferase